MRAGTCFPSDAGIMTISGLIHLNESHSAVGEVVSCAIAAAGRFAMTKISGGRLAVEKTSAMRRPSGEIVMLCPPSPFVIRWRAPPPMGMRYA